MASISEEGIGKTTASAAAATPLPPPPPPPKTPDNKASSRTVLTPGTPSRGRTQALKDLKLTIEYKHLKHNAPGGVLVTPAFDDLRLWHGVIFLRRGLCEGGVFRFVVRLSPQYNDHGVYPEVRFTPPGAVWNPYVHPDTGELDLKSTYPTWDPSIHFMITVLTFIKRIFYLKDPDLESYDDHVCYNIAAKRLFLSDKVEFRRHSQKLVLRSQEAAYDVSDIHSGDTANDLTSSSSSLSERTETSSSSSSTFSARQTDGISSKRNPLSFLRPHPAHEALRTILIAQAEGGLTVHSSAQVLEACRQAKLTTLSSSTPSGIGEDPKDSSSVETGLTTSFSSASTKS